MDDYLGRIAPIRPSARLAHIQKGSSWIFSSCRLFSQNPFYHFPRTILRSVRLGLFFPSYAFFQNSLQSFLSQVPAGNSDYGMILKRPRKLEKKEMLKKWKDLQFQFPKVGSVKESCCLLLPSRLRCPSLRQVLLLVHAASLPGALPLLSCRPPRLEVEKKKWPMTDSHRASNPFYLNMMTQALMMWFRILLALPLLKFPDLLSLLLLPVSLLPLCLHLLQVPRSFLNLLYFTSIFLARAHFPSPVHTSFLSEPFCLASIPSIKDPCLGSLSFLSLTGKTLQRSSSWNISHLPCFYQSSISDYVMIGQPRNVFHS